MRPCGGISRAAGEVAAGPDGGIHGGCNVENAAFPQGLCAEASAIAALVGADGSGTIRGGSIGFGFAIPVDHAERIAGELIATGKAAHGGLGVQARIAMESGSSA